MEADPLQQSLAEIRPKLHPDIQPLVDAILADEPLEDAWKLLLQGVLDAA
jgi:hypothetical protein